MSEATYETNLGSPEASADIAPDPFFTMSFEELLDQSRSEQEYRPELNTESVVDSAHTIFAQLAHIPETCTVALSALRDRIRTMRDPEAVVRNRAVQPDARPIVEPRSSFDLPKTVADTKSAPLVIEHALESMWAANNTQQAPVFTDQDQTRLETEFASRLETVQVQPLGIIDRFKGWLGRVTSYRISEPTWVHSFVTEQASSYQRTGSSPTQWALDRAKIRGLSHDQLQHHFIEAEQYVARAHRQQANHQIPTLPVGAWERNVYTALVNEMIRRNLAT